MAGKEFAPVKKISFYDRNGNEIEDSNGDSFEDEQKVINIHTDGGESYIDVGVSEDHPVWFHEFCKKKKLTLNLKLRLFQKCTNRQKDSHHRLPLKKMKNTTH